MRDFSSFGIVSILCFAMSPLNAQTNDWQAVERIVPGSAISISILDHRGRRECVVLKVRDSDLACELQRGNFSRRITFLRSEIRDIRLEYPEDGRTITGALIGSAAGGILGGVIAAASKDPETRVLTPVVGVFDCGALGAGIGRGIHRHGAVLYQRR